MADLYYSQRKRISKKEPSLELGQEFWLAFRGYIQRLADKEEGLTEAFPVRCFYGKPKKFDIYYLNLILHEKVAGVQWAFPDVSPGNDKIFDLIEFFSLNVSKFKKNSGWQECECDQSHPVFSRKEGAEDFYQSINEMFVRYHHPYELVGGQVRLKSSIVLDKWIFESIDFRTEDDELKRLMTAALDDYFDRSGSKKVEALNHLANALERLKTLEGQKKDKSIKKVLNNISEYEEIRTHFDDRLKYLTKLHNELNIRHNEKGKIEIKDTQLAEFLFYSYYSLIRLILSKYKIL